MVIFLLVLQFLDQKLHGFYNIHALSHIAKTTRLPSNPHFWQCRWKTGDDLGWVQICPGQDSRTCILKYETLIIKSLLIDGLASCAIMTYRVTTLIHKFHNNYAKAGTFIIKFFLHGPQSINIFCYLWKFVCKQFKGDSADPRAQKNMMGLTMAGWGCLQGRGHLPAVTSFFIPFKNFNSVWITQFSVLFTHCPRLCCLLGTNFYCVLFQEIETIRNIFCWLTLTAVVVHFVWPWNVGGSYLLHWWVACFHAPSSLRKLATSPYFK